MSEPRQCLLVLRHGQTAYNFVGRFQGQRDEPLDDTGREQARVVAPAIAAMQPTALVSSDLIRAVDTASCIAELTGLSLAVEPGLREIDLGAWSGRTAEEASTLFPDEYAAWARGENVRRGGGETYPEVADRAVAVLAPLVAAQPPTGLVVAVTHGGTVRSIVGRMLGLPADAWACLGPTGNCAWAEIRMLHGRWRLARYGMRA